MMTGKIPHSKAELDGIKTSVLIAVPTFDNRVDTRCIYSIMNLITNLSIRGIICSLIFKRGSLINRVRNYIVHEFMELKFTHLLFIDSDLYGFEHLVVKMLDADHDVCGGIYPIKEINEFMYHCNQLEKLPFKEAHHEACDFNINTLKPVPQLLKEADTSNGFVEVDEVATGCLMIKRRVIQKMMAAYPERNFVPLANSEFMSRSLYNFFDAFIHPKTRFYLSEDYGFCHLWKNIGGKIYAEIATKLTHIGEFTYEGSYYDYLTKFAKYHHMQNRLLNRIECLHSQEKMWIGEYDNNINYFDKTKLLNSAMSSDVLDTLLDCLDLDLGSDSTILDLGSGTGETPVYLASKYGCSVEGVDYSKKRLDKSANLVREKSLVGKVRYHVSDIHHFLNRPNQETYDLITAFRTLEKLTDPKNVVDDAMKLLKPGGIFLGVSRISHDDLERTIITNFNNKKDLKKRLNVKIIKSSEPLHDKNLVIFFRKKDGEKQQATDVVTVNTSSLKQFPNEELVELSKISL